jgi:hypothetical protein
VGVARMAQPDNFTTNTIFLRRKCEGGEGGAAKFGIASQKSMKAASADLKLNVAEPKRGRFPGRYRVFPGS